MQTLLKKFFRWAFSRETILYLVFGVLTAAVSYLSFYVFYRWLGEDLVLLVNTISFLCAATFAYVTNKLFVFEEKSWSFSVLRKQIPMFYGARLFSFFVEELGLWICTVPLHAARYLILGLDGVLFSKIVMSLLSVLINYVFSKFWVFRRNH